MTNANQLYFLGRAVPPQDKYRTIRGGDLAGTVVSKPGVIGYGEYFSIAGDRVNGGAFDVTIRYRTLVSHDGIDGSNGEFLNPIWGPWQGVSALTNITTEFDVAIDPLVTDGIQAEMTNNSTAIVAKLPDGSDPDGDGMVIVGKWWS